MPKRSSPFLHTPPPLYPPSPSCTAHRWFADEVDAFLTKRGGASEHEATLSAKTEFMQLWDGIEGARGMRVLVMGATNRCGLWLAAGLALA